MNMEFLKAKKAEELTVEERFIAVKTMDEIMHSANDEEIWAAWIMLGCPDVSCEDDYWWFAEDPEEYDSLVNFFRKLVKREPEIIAEYFSKMGLTSC